jgi:integrase
MWKRIRSALGDRPINTISPRDIRAFVDDQVSEGLSPAYVRDLYGLVRMTFEYAVADQLITQTPCVRVSLPKRQSDVIPADPDHVQALSAAIDPRYQALVWFLAGTGVRIGEALAVRVADVVDIPRPAVRISRAVTTDEQGRATVGPPKTRAGHRTITLPDWLPVSIRSHIATYGLGSDSWLFPAPSGGLMDQRRLLGRFWSPAAKVASCPELRPHMIRHLHASQLIESGLPLTEISARLGHANSQVTASRYAHWLRPDDSASADAVPNIVGGASAGGG